MYECPKCKKFYKNKKLALACGCVPAEIIKQTVELQTEKPKIEEPKREIEEIIPTEKPEGSNLDDGEGAVKEELDDLKEKEVPNWLIVIAFLILGVAVLFFFMHEKAIAFIQNMFARKEVKDERRTE